MAYLSNVVSGWIVAAPSPSSPDFPFNSRRAREMKITLAGLWHRPHSPRVKRPEEEEEEEEKEEEEEEKWRRDEEWMPALI